MTSTPNLMSMLSGLLGNRPAGGTAATSDAGPDGFAGLIRSLLGGNTVTEATTSTFGTNSSTISRSSDGHMTVRLGGNDLSLDLPGLEDIEALLARWTAAPVPAGAETAELETALPTEASVEPANAIPDLVALLDAIDLALAETGAPRPDTIDGFALGIDSFILKLEAVVTQPSGNLPADQQPGEADPALTEARALGTRLAELADQLKGALGPMATDLIARVEAAATTLQSAGFTRNQLAALGFAMDSAAPATSFDVSLDMLIAGTPAQATDGTVQPPAAPRTQLAMPEDLRVTPEPRSDSPDRAATDAAPSRGRPAAAPVATADAAGLPDPGLLQQAGDPAGGAAQIAQQARAEAAAVPRLAQVAYQAQAPQLNLPVLAGEIVRQVEAGMSRFQIRLDPPELGRIDVRMDVADNGSVHTRLTVEKAETLDLLQRDQRALERALAQAGLDTSRTSLEFSLRQNPFGSQQQGDGRDPRFGGGSSDSAATGGADQPPAVITHYRLSASPGGVNIIA